DTCRGISPHFILDDGSHRLRDQKQTFQALFPFLLPGGAYIIEDLHTSFGSHKDKYGWESQTAFEWLSDLSEALNSQEVIPKSTDLFSEYVVSSIDEITFIKRAVKIRKKENSKKSFHRTSILNSD